MKYLITPSLLNSWKYAIDPSNDYGNLEDFKKVLYKEPFEPTEAIELGFQFEDFMIKNYEPTKNGCYQISASKDIETSTGKYVLYGRLDCLKAGRITDYKYTGSYKVGKFYGSYQTQIYFVLVPEAYEFEYLISNNFEPDKTSDEINLYKEVYKRNAIDLDIENEIDCFISWLEANNLLDLYHQFWKSKY